MVDQDGAELALSFAQDTLQGFFDVLLGVGEGDDADGGGLPDVVKIEFSDGDVELAAQAGFEAAEDLALVLEGVGVGELQVEEEEAYGHFSRKYKSVRVQKYKGCRRQQERWFTRGPWCIRLRRFLC